MELDVGRRRARALVEGGDGAGGKQRAGNRFISALAKRGGFIARLFSKPADGAIVHPAGIILSVIGALILLYVLQRAGY